VRGELLVFYKGTLKRLSADPALRERNGAKGNAVLIYFFTAFFLLRLSVPAKRDLRLRVFPHLLQV
jgi:hypothetical protein